MLTAEQRITAVVTFILIGAIIAWSAWAAWYWGRTATVSWTMALLARRHPLLAFAAAFAYGHVFIVRWQHAGGQDCWAVLAAGLALGATLAAQSPDAMESP